jgi:DNA-binding LacI/PurR family transcriptional regulator
VRSVNFLSITDQAVEHLRAEILRGRWTGAMPGKHRLAAELGINSKTVEAALRQLEKVGLLIPRGAGRRRLVQVPSGSTVSALRIGFLLNEGEQDLQSSYSLEIYHALTNAGHSVMYAPKSLVALGFDERRVARMVRQQPADAWVVWAGSRSVLEWFAGQPVPAFALFGHRIGVRLASVGPNKLPAVAEATRQLIELGHRRIVLLCRRLRRLPQPGATEATFLATLEERGFPVGDYNLPDWEETNAGFQACLESLFQVTPPSAFIVEEAPYFVAVLQFLARRGIRVPGDVSLICTDDDLAFAHCEPTVARITWDSRPLVRRIVNWAANVSQGKPDLRQTSTPSRFIPGGTIGRAPTTLGVPGVSVQKESAGLR